jgi:hypothetical protein
MRHPYRETSLAEPPRPRDLRPLFRALYAVALLCVASGATSLAILSSGCHPNLPPQTTCRVGSYACVNDQPRVCSQSQRLEPIGDAPCSRVGWSLTQTYDPTRHVVCGGRFGRHPAHAMNAST